MNPTLPDFVQDLGDGVHAIDTGFHRDHFDAAYLLVQDGRAAFIDTGAAPGVPRLLAALQALGLPREAVDLVIPTHVHLDHAGGAGTLMAALPRATMWVHPRGARHMIDPSVLWAGATAVYGAEEMARAYGEALPVPAERVQTTADGLTVHLAGRALEFADTPGHARHHHCIWDTTTRGWFTGDTFGLSYPEFTTARGPWMLPTSTPVQFEPEVLRQSVQRLLARQPECMYLTHYGRVRQVQARGAQLMALLDEMVALGLAQRHAPDRDMALQRGQLEIFVRSLAAHGCTHSRDEIAALLALDLKLNAQGMAVWLDRE